MPNQTLFLPLPREISKLSDEIVTLPDAALIVIANSQLFFEAQLAQTALNNFAGLDWPIVAGDGYDNTGLLLEIEDSIPQAEAYQLVTRDNRVLIRGADAAGVYYGVCTLRQMLQQHQNLLPSLRINDSPDYPARGVMLDISRDKVPTLETVLDLIDRLSTLKVNQLQLYMEHTFAYQAHKEVWAKASPFTGQEIMTLDAFCRQRHVELVPNTQCLGHMERWLKLPRYNELAEMPEGYYMPWREETTPTSLNPVDFRSVDFVGSLYDELLPHFTSKRFNVGGDEPWELGQGRSKAERERIGEGRLYLNYLLKIYEEVTARRKQMMFWDDIIVKFPELIPELPYDIIAMIWGYEANHPFDERCALFADINIPFYVCPGTSSWNTFAGRTDNTVRNQRSAALNGLKSGAIGYLNTDWGDRGHWQQNSISYLGFAYGAGVSWNAEGDLDNLPALLDLFVFEDLAGVMGSLAYDLGNLYLLPGHSRPNGHMLVDLMRASREDIEEQQTLIAQLKQADESPRQTLERLWSLEEQDAQAEALLGNVRRNGLVVADPASYQEALDDIERIMASLDNADMQRPDSDLIKAEFTLAADFMHHAALRGLMLLGQGDMEAAALHDDLELLIERYRHNWLARNRPGGLEDSVARFQKALSD